MEDRIIDSLVLNSKKQIRWAGKFGKRRYLFGEIRGIDREYFVGIKGIRGVGKTVLMLQLAREAGESVYFSADSTPLKPFPLYDVVKELVGRGFRNIFIDEIHRKTGWDSDMKSIYDEHEARIMFSGSSALDITKTTADLSRRVVLKEMKPVSLREYMNIRKGRNIPVFSFGDILERKNSLARKYAEVHDYLRDYMRYGGVLYPKNGFFEAMENSIRKVILQDLSVLRDINVKYETDVYKLLYLVSRSMPFEVNYSSLARSLEVSKNMAIRIVKDLEKTGLITVVFPCRKRGTDVRKEPKLYLATPLREFFSREGAGTDKGAFREEFFVNHASGIKGLCYMKGARGEKTPDFRFKNIVVEIGGKSKTGYQNPDCIAVDGLSTTGIKIPLFLFGFIY